MNQQNPVWRFSIMNKKNMTPKRLDFHKMLGEITVRYKSSPMAAKWKHIYSLYNIKQE